MTGDSGCLAGRYWVLAPDAAVMGGAPGLHVGSDGRSSAWCKREWHGGSSHRYTAEPTQRRCGAAFTPSSVTW